MTVINNRYEFVLFFDVENGNPNGDPDAGNMPRIDPETGHGLVTDVCLKRKIRNFIELVKDGDSIFKIYVQEKSILNKQHESVYKELDENDSINKVIPKDLISEITKIVKEMDDTLQINGNQEQQYLVLSPYADLKKLRKKIKNDKKNNDAVIIAKRFVRDFLETDIELFAQKRMCKNFFDVRTFGAVMSTGDYKCGQVRGPVQLAFAQSVDPIIPQEISITRMAVTNEKDLEKERTMGRKHIVSYALYRAEGFVSAPLAAKTGFSEEDLELLWNSLIQMFEHDRSAARGKMSTRKLIVFKHDSKLGNAPAHKLFDLVSVERNGGGESPVRSFSHYKVDVDESGVPEGVTCQVKL